MLEKNNTDVVQSKKPARPERFFVAMFCCFLILPYILALLGVNSVGVRLSGALNPNQRPDYTLQTVMSGEYEHRYALWHNENFPARNYFIKVYSQLKYSLFNTSSAAGIVVGKDGYLFGPGPFIQGALGMRVTPRDQLATYVSLIKSVQDSCDVLGKGFLYVIPVHKAQLYLDKAPARYFAAASATEENEQFHVLLREGLEEAGVRYFDTLEYVNANSASKYPYFTRTGTHWNYVLASEVVKEIADNSAYNLGFNSFSINGINEVLDPVHPDTDIMLLSNLIFPIKDTYYYPEIVKSESPERRTIFINGTSFNYEIARIFIESGIASDVYNLEYTRNIMSWNQADGNSDYRNADSIYDIGVADMLRESDTVILSINALQFDPQLLDAANVIDWCLTQFRQERGV